MNDKTPETDNLIQFPPTLRVVPIEPVPVLLVEHELALIEHDGRMYDLALLVQQLSPGELQEIGAVAPRSGQEMWDAIVRRWPALAAEIVAGGATGVVMQTAPCAEPGQRRRSGDQPSARSSCPCFGRACV